MIFNSPTFLGFLLLVYCLYWALNRRGQNVLLLLASYVFYAWWDWRFLSLIWLSSAIDYSVGLQLGRTQSVRWRKLWLGLSLLANLGLLGFFKYFNFFAESFAQAAAQLGYTPSDVTLSIVLPVGISFYTFQTLSYTIDVYRRKCEPHANIIDFFVFVAFFPQLVAGPIERASHLLNQFAVERRFELDQAKDGLRQMLWGFFKKIVIADGLAGYVNHAYSGATGVGGSVLLLATYFFAFQIYCDFSGYSDIAIGCARLFGFNLRRNFAYPYFARTLREFWQRWHISLSTWFRDYLYIPLGGSRLWWGGILFTTFVTFTVSGLWHGANWTFVLWGILHALYLFPSVLYRHGRGHAVAVKPTALPTLRDIPAILLTFHLVLLGWILFRAASLDHFVHILTAIATDFDLRFFVSEALRLKALVVGLLLIEWVQRHKAHPLQIEGWPVWARWGIYNAAGFAILLLGVFDYQPFIYFQF